MEMKYELLKDDCIDLKWEGEGVLYRIKALRDFNDVKKGDIGGYIEKEDNLSHVGNCWVYDDAIVRGNATICDNVIIFDNAVVKDDAVVTDNAQILNDSIVGGNAQILNDSIVRGKAQILDNSTISNQADIYDNAIISGNVIIDCKTKISTDAIIKSETDYIVMGPLGNRNDYITFYRTNNGIRTNCGCFNDTIDKFKERVIKVYNGNKYAKEYLYTIDYINNIFSIR